MARSLNKAQLIGNLTRDPELRYTPSGAAVCTFGLATNRQWTTDSGEKREDVEFHRLVAWNKLAELCAQLLSKGRKVFVEGRLQTRKWQAQDGSDRVTTEIVISDMIILDSRGAVDSGSDFDVPEDDISDVEAPMVEETDKSESKKSSSKPDDKKKIIKKAEDTSDDASDDIPF
jgi:single-strand DNA-binding protein